MDNSDKLSRPRSRRDKERGREAVLNSGYDSLEDVELTADHVAYFREAGASEIFLTLISTDSEDAGVDRNSVQQEAQQYIYYSDLDSEDPDEFTHEGGPFFRAIWQGHLYDAYRNQADPNNAALLEHAFGEDRINEDRPTSDYPKASELGPDRFFICTLPIGPESFEGE